MSITNIPVNFTILHCTSSVKAAVAVIAVERGRDRDTVLEEYQLSANPFYQAQKLREEGEDELFFKVAAGELAVSKATEMARYRKELAA